MIARRSCKNLSYKWWHERWKIQTYDKTHMFSATDSEQAAQWHHGSCTSPPAPFSSAIPSSANIKQLDIPGTSNSESPGITENCRPMGSNLPASFVFEPRGGFQFWDHTLDVWGSFLTQTLEFIAFVYCEHWRPFAKTSRKERTLSTICVDAALYKGYQNDESIIQ